MTPNLLRIVLGSLFVAIVLLGIPMSMIALRRLRQGHPQTWAELGEPSFFWNMSPRNQMRLSRFMWSKAYRQLNDPVLTRILDASRLMTILGVVLFGAFVISQSYWP